MSDISVSTLVLWVIVMLVVSGFFSIAETAMMAVNRYRLRHRAKQGARGAKLALSLLAKTDKLLGVILLGNTLVAAAAATMTAVITKRLFGEGEGALALGTVAISFALLVFSEITPKVVGAALGMAALGSGAGRTTPTPGRVMLTAIRPTASATVVISQK